MRESTCQGCGETFQRESSVGVGRYCPPCGLIRRRERGRRYKENNRERVNENQRKYRAADPERARVLGRRAYWDNPERRRAQWSAYYQRNVETLRARSLRWHEDNPEQSKAIRDRWHEGNREHSRELARKWGQENPDRVRANGAARRARKRSATVETVSPVAVFERDTWTCGVCDEPVDATLQWPDPRSASLDHIVPLSVGGEHSYANVQCTHLTCNVSKRSTSLADARGRMRRTEGESA